MLSYFCMIVYKRHDQNILVTKCTTKKFMVIYHLQSYFDSGFKTKTALLVRICFC